MQIPVAFKNGKERSVSKGELQFLIETEQIMFFKRSDGWVVIGRDKLRSQRAPYSGEDRR
ncbi:MAG: hypothetical protein KAU22_02605 [Desulfuromonadales bacterium]|nr:hypothetical protein [Desulfuromonadales bacterium]